MFATPAFSAWSLANLPQRPADAVCRAPWKVALLLNCNARAVDDDCVRRAREVLGSAHVYASHSLAQAEQMARRVAAGGYDVVVCGGGDGTLADGINRVLRHRRELAGAAVDEDQDGRPARHARKKRTIRGPDARATPPPKFAFLPLGTGNALRHVVHSREPWAELRALVRGRRFAVRRVPLVLDDAGNHFFFGGLGYDSLLLHDYNQLLREPRPAWAQPLVRSWAGYVYALGRDTLPRLARGGGGLQLRIVTRRRAYYFDPARNDAAVPVAAGSVLYEGPAGMLGVGTVPYFGYGMRVFPFAGVRRGTMQLRVAKLPAGQVLANLGAIWRGSYRNRADLLDFAVSEVEVQLQGPFPFERSGDDGGLVRRLRLRLSPAAVTLVDWGRPLPAAPRVPSLIGVPWA